MRLLPRSIAYLVAAGAVAAVGAAIVVEVVAAGRDAGDAGSVWLAPFMLAAVAAPAAVGAFVVARRPGNRVGWILLAGALSVGLVLRADAISRLELGEDRSSRLGAWAGVVALEWPAFFVWPLLLAYLYPSLTCDSEAAIGGSLRRRVEAAADRRRRRQVSRAPPAASPPRRSKGASTPC